MQTLYIKNMVCRRCLISVERILNDLHIGFLAVRLGEVDLVKAPTSDELSALTERLEAVGFEVLDNHRQILIEKIKNLIIATAHSSGDEARKVNLSETLSHTLLKNYSSLTTMFSEVEGVTIEQYYIAQKIERAKELLAYDELTISEIADQLGYSSVSHLSSQFKKVTGLTPTFFKQSGTRRRQSIEMVKTKIL